MSVHGISSRHSDCSTHASSAAPIARQLALNPLWVVTFAAGLLFGMLAVLLTAG